MNPQDLKSGLLLLLNWARRGCDKVDMFKPVCIGIFIQSNSTGCYTYMDMG